VGCGTGAFTEAILENAADRLGDCFEAASLDEVAVRPLEVEMTFTGFDDYWTPFLGGQAPAPAYAMSLDDAARERLSALIRSRLAPETDGSIRMASRAWAVRGTAR
jgi:hypothetical protein